MSDEEDFFEEELLTTGINKIRELFSGEIKLIRTIFISCLTVIIICILLYFNYILIGQFFTTIFLSFILSLALKHTKEKLVKQISDVFIKKRFFVKKSVLFIILQYVIAFLKIVGIFVLKIVGKLRKDSNSNYSRRESREIIWKKGISPANSMKTLNISENDNSIDNNSTIFNKNYLLFVCIVYIVIFKLEFHLSLTLIFVYLFADFIIRIILDMTFSIVKFTNRNSFFKNLIFEEKSSYELNEFMHSIISLVIIVSFSIILVTIFLFSMWLLYIDMKSMVVYIRENNDYSNYFKNILPENIKEFYNSEKLDSFYNTNIFVHLKSFEEYMNTTIDEQFNSTDNIRGNMTLYDISNNLIGFFKDPSEEGKMGKYQCVNYEEDFIYRIVGFTGVEYVKNLYCGGRILIDKFNLTGSISIFSKYLKQGYIFFLKTFKLLAGSVFLNLLSFSLELINFFMLVILFLSCLYNFLKMKGDLIKDMLKFLPYQENKITEIHKFFHTSIQGVFVCTLEIFFYHTLLTWMIFDFCNIRFVFLFSVLSGIVTLVPIITPWLVLIPANMIDVIDNEFSPIKIILFSISYYLLINIADNDIYKKNMRKSDPYVTGLSFVMGMYTFGFKGIIYGPVLLCVSITAIDIVKNLIKIK